MPEAEFLARYSVRLELTDKLLRTILSNGPQDEPEHVIVQGQRGQGKTSLLRRIQIALRDNQETRDWLIPLLFREELYGVTSLCRLWEEAASLLCDRPGFTGLPEAIEAAWETPYYEKDCYLILDRALADQGLRLVLLIDNIGDLFGKLKRPEQQRLREILHTTKRIQILGASTVMLEQHYDHGAPFYQFFREINLPGLSQEEALTLLRHLGTAEQQARLEEVIVHTPGRIETLRRLTAGVPRTLVLLFEILLDRDGNAFRDLELLLDRVTPLYKHRMDDLPTQQQAIVDAVALGWDALSAGEIARATRLPSKQIAAQLKQLERANVIHTEATSTKNNLYRLAERFFNIWYLMRHGRPGDRRRALWLVRFLEIWCSPDDLRARALGHLTMLSDALLAPDHAWLMTEALRGAGLDLETEDRLVKATREYLAGDLRDRVEPSVTELVEEYESAFPAHLRPLFDRERMAAMDRIELLEYVKKALKLCDEFSSLLTKSTAIGGQLVHRMERGDLDGALSDLEAREKVKAPEGYDIYPGLVELWNQTDGIYARLREAGLELSSEMRRLRIGDSGLGVAFAYVWNQEVPKAFEVLEARLPRLDFDAEASGITTLLTVLLAAEQTAYVRRLFEDEAFAAYRFKDRFKPHYFALLAELGESRANDFKRMGPELAQTVDEIRAKVVGWRKSMDGRSDLSRPT
ncbi:NACHT domain-containing protein [uncultured Thiodictyon sp.]|uniref:NACHT domain-containing protein n=1 Tax=uncultured Thiodictyon sp. TaxID=1846217 RepID=UPI0025FBE987|nr:NACHT domain-containing protein [uncultured Thiodictyon sp.]